MDVTKVVELRVHGVSGTPPQDLLGVDLVTRVAGDATAGFYRPTLDVQRTDGAPGAPLEGYVWGGLTSGAPSRAFWLLLLPFTLINVAPRLRPGPAAGQRSTAVRLLWYVTLLLALCLTLSLVLGAAGIGLDLLGWQCAQDHAACGGAPSWLVRTVTQMAPSRRLALAALAPLLTLSVLALLSSRSAARYESVEPHVPRPVDGDAIEVGLDSPWMWRGKYRVHRLAAVHLQAGLAATLATVAWAIRPGWHAIVLAIADAVVLNAAVLLALPATTGHRATPRWLVWWLRTGWIVVTLASALTALAMVTGHAPLATHHRPGTPLVGLPRFAGTLFWLFAAQLVLLILIAVLVTVIRTPDRTGPRPGLRGRGTVLLAGSGVMIGAVFSAGGYVYGAAWLATGSLKPHVREVSAAVRRFAVPEAIRDATVAYALAVALLAVAVVLTGGWALYSYLLPSPSRWPMAGHEFEADYPGRPETDQRGKQVLRALWVGGLVDKGGRVLEIILLPGFLLTLWITGMYVTGHGFGWRWPLRQADLIAGNAVPGGNWPLARSGWHSATSLQALGAYLIVGSLILLVGLALAAFRVQATRRSLGILWDLASFWPRAVHPFAAPCYAERTVPDLSVRVDWYVRGENPSEYPTGAVVLAGHSQGTVISAAVLLQLAGADRSAPSAVPVVPRIAYLSFGCVLRRLYARYFRAYFGPEVLDELAGRLDGPTGLRWRNLWRYSDYLGGPVAQGPPRTGTPASGLITAADVHLIDPAYDIPPGDTAYPLPQRHSNYPLDPTFQRTVGALADLL